MTQEEKNVVQTVEQEVISPTSDVQEIVSHYGDYVEAERILNRIKDSSESILSDYYHIAGYLRKFAEKEYYKILGFNDLISCCRLYLPDFSDTLIKNLLLVGNRCLEKSSGYSYSGYAVKNTYKDISWSKLVELVSVPEDQELIELISDKPVKAIREVKKEIKNLGVDKVKVREKYIKSILDEIKRSLNLSDFKLIPARSQHDESTKYSSTYTEGNIQMKISVAFSNYGGDVDINLSNCKSYSINRKDELSKVIVQIRKSIRSIIEEKQERLDLNKLKKQVDKSKAPKRLTDDYDAYVKDLKNWKLLINYPDSKISIYQLLFEDYEFIMIDIKRNKFVFEYTDYYVFERYLSYIADKLKEVDDDIYQTWFDAEFEKIKKKAGVKHE